MDRGNNREADFAWTLDAALGRPHLAALIAGIVLSISFWLPLSATPCRAEATRATRQRRVKQGLEHSHALECSPQFITRIAVTLGPALRAGRIAPAAGPGLIAEVADAQNGIGLLGASPIRRLNALVPPLSTHGRADFAAFIPSMRI